MISDPPDPPEGGCPDGAVCHHNCKAYCWRVLNCGPLSGYYEKDTWPDVVIAEHIEYRGKPQE